MTEREKLVELMARAMCVNEDQDPDHVFVPVTGKPESVVMWTHWKDDVEAALTALEAAGVRLVPVEMSIDMDVAATEAWRADQAWEDRSRSIYRAAIAASPYAPEEG